MTDAAFFATDGLISIDRVLVMGGDTSANPGDVLRYMIFLKNRASSVAVKNVGAIMTSPDTAATVQSTVVSYGNLAPGASAAGSKLFTVEYSEARSGSYSIPLTVNRKDGRLLCHLCGATRPVPEACPNEACRDPEAALGARDFNADDLTTFLCLGSSGHVTLGFVDNVIVDRPGMDLRIYGDPDNNEYWHVDVSSDGVTWALFGPQDEVVQLDLEDVGLTMARFIRLTDTGTGPAGAFAGAELDAVYAIHSQSGG